MEELEKALFYKPTGTVQIANKFSLVERKLLNAIIYHSQKNRFKTQEQSMPVRDIFELIGLAKSRNNEVLKDALRVLTSTIIEWNTFGEDKSREWGVCTFLASGKVSSGKLIYRLNPELIQQINQPTLYAKIQLLVQSQVRKRHALVLYEFFLDSLSRVKKDSLKVVIALEKLYQLLGVNSEMTYKFFNRDVIKPSLREISKHTDIEVTHTTNRKGRYVAEVVFVVEKKDFLQMSLDLEIQDEEKLEKFDDIAKISEIKSEEEFIELLKYHGVNLTKARELVKSYDLDRIRGNIEYLLEQQAKGKTIANAPAYLVKAIKEDYRPKESPKQVQEQEKKKEQEQAKKQAKAAKAKRDKLESEWKRFCEDRVKEHFSEKPEEWQEEKRQLFVEKIKQQAKEGNSILFNSYKKDAFNGVMIKATFYSELRGELLTRPEETDFKNYLEFRNQH